MYTLSADIQAWPTPAKRIDYSSDSLMALRKYVRQWRKFAQLEDNHVLNMDVRWVEPRDLAHEADMDRLRKEQLRGDISVEEANEAFEMALLDEDWDF